MTNEHEPPLSDDELISAYHDGELTGEELARAEQLISSDPASRSLLEELRAMRGELTEIERRTLGPEFVDRVLRRAEREMLTAKPTSDEASEQAPNVFERMRTPRTWMYAAMALAAAVVVMIAAPTSIDEQAKAPQVAHAPAKQNEKLHEELSAPPATGPTLAKGGGMAGRPEGAALAVPKPAALADRSGVDASRDGVAKNDEMSPKDGEKGSNRGAEANSASSNFYAATETPQMAQQRVAVANSLASAGYQPPLANALASQSAVLEFTAPPADPAQGLLTVVVEVDPQQWAAGNVFFNETLQRNNIVIENSTPMVVQQELGTNALVPLQLNMTGQGERGADQIVHVVASGSQLLSTLDTLRQNRDIELRCVNAPPKDVALEQLINGDRQNMSERKAAGSGATQAAGEDKYQAAERENRAAGAGIKPTAGAQLEAGKMLAGDALRQKDKMLPSAPSATAKAADAPVVGGIPETPSLNTAGEATSPATLTPASPAAPTPTAATQEVQFGAIPQPGNDQRSLFRSRAWQFSVPSEGDSARRFADLDAVDELRLQEVEKLRRAAPVTAMGREPTDARQLQERTEPLPEILEGTSQQALFILRAAPTTRGGQTAGGASAATANPMPAGPAPAAPNPTDPAKPTPARKAE